MNELLTSTSHHYCGRCRFYVNPSSSWGSREGRCCSEQAQAVCCGSFEFLITYTCNSRHMTMFDSKCHTTSLYILTDRPTERTNDDASLPLSLSLSLSLSLPKCSKRVGPSNARTTALSALMISYSPRAVRLCCVYARPVILAVLIAVSRTRKLWEIVSCCSCTIVLNKRNPTAECSSESN